jgi:hypothetical protein
MSDAARFMEAAAESFGWKQGTFAELLRWNRKQANEAVIEADVFASALADLLEQNDGDWRGTTTELRETLTPRAPEKAARSPFWPLTTAATSAALTRVKDALETVGFTFHRGQEGRKRERRFLQFTRLKDANLQSS